MDMMNECACAGKNVVTVPVCGQSLELDLSALDCLSEERVRELIDERLGSIGAAKPILNIGVETVWPSIYEGKQVYAKLIDFGSLPASGVKTVDHGVEDIEWINVHPGYSHVTTDSGLSYPVNLPSATTAGMYNCSVGKEYIRIAVGNNRSAWRATICVLYTRTTDPIIA